ncbi:MAG: hypothetical protein R2788_03215 [Saprospiraceae bacterium]
MIFLQIKPSSFLYLLLAVATLSSCSSFGNKEKEQAKELVVPVKKGEFKIFVTATGELKAKNSEEIKGPAGMRGAQIYNATISDLVRRNCCGSRPIRRQSSTQRN